MTLNEKKEVLFSITHSYFLEKGFKYIRKLPQRYLKKEKEHIYCLSFGFKTRSNLHDNSNIQIHHKVVEKIVIEIGIPTNKLETQKEGKEFLYTVVQKSIVSANAEKPNNIVTPIITEEDFIDWGKRLINYMEMEGLPFIEHYSYLPNVLTEMNRLEKEGKYWHEILGGRLEHVFRGLIISKLCNDYDYERKFKRWEEIICGNSKYEKWYPYLKKLKEKLATLKPIYNL